MECGSQSRRGSLTAIGACLLRAVTSEPVSQSTMRIVKVFWTGRGTCPCTSFPAINWLNSYSLYLDNLRPWFDENLGKSFLKNREKAMAILQEESELQEIVKLVGIDSLSDKDRLTLETAKMIREDFLQQNAFVDTDNYSDYERQAMLLEIILKYGELSQSALSQGAKLQDLINIEAKEVIGRAKVVPIDEYKEEYTRILKEMTEQINKTKARGELDD